MKIPIQRYWDMLVVYLRPLRNKVGLLGLLLSSTIVIQVLNPQIVRYFIDTVSQPDSDPQQLTWAALAFLGLALVIQVFSVWATYIGEDIGWRATNALRADLARYALKLDMSFHNEHTPGEMIERIDGDVADLAIFFSQFVIKIIANLVLVVGVLLMMFLIDWRVGAAMTLFTIITLGSFNKVRDLAQPYWTAAREAAADLFGFLEEHLSGTEDTRSSGAVPYVMNGLFKFNRVRLEKERKAGVMNILVIMLWIALYTAAQMIAFGLGYSLFRSGAITLGTGYLILNYTDAIFRPLREITNEIQNLQKAGASIERVQELYNIKTKIQDGDQSGLGDKKGAISVEFAKVNFTYNDEDRVLHDLNLNLQPGKILGLLGRTGSGKTTIARLLFRLYEISDGAILLDGQEIRTIPLKELRQKIGLVTQNVQLFRASIRNNLTFFDKTISDERIMQVIDELELMEWYAKLANGLDTELEAGGGGLSAGEAQLLAFARIFLKNPSLVILDEASSRLDPATEQLIERAVDKLLKDRTGIIIAHRLGTVQRADEIMILEKGRVLEHGSYDALAYDPASRFYELLKTGGLQEMLA